MSVLIQMVNRAYNAFIPITIFCVAINVRRKEYDIFDIISCIICMYIIGFFFEVLACILCRKYDDEIKLSPVYFIGYSLVLSIVYILKA